jgi:hypothetical protein
VTEELKPETKACTPEPCPEDDTPPTHRSFGQVLNPADWARCPVCREPIDRAEMILVERREPPMRWWRRLALAARYGHAPVTGWVEHERVAVFGPCGCYWADTDNPLMRLVVEMHAAGAVFRAEPRHRWQAGPHLVLEPVSGGCTCARREDGDWNRCRRG